MTQELSLNTQAILLLTAPLMLDKKSDAGEVLTLGEYKRLARHLRSIGCKPVDLIVPDADEVLDSCGEIVDEGRLRRLLGRGFQLACAVEHWQSRGIWVVSRADAAYPRRLKKVLREDCPTVLYGCGDIGLLDQGGLAVVGSRHAGQWLLDYAADIGRQAADFGKTIVSGGARGIDRAAMRGAMRAGGTAVGIMAEGLEISVLPRERCHRMAIAQERAVLVSPFDPKAAFTVSRAMWRNKLVYALADAALVVNAEIGRGGTWTGALEQLERLRFVPVFVRSTGRPCEALDALLERGALPWSNPQDAASFETVLSTEKPSARQATLF